MGEDLPIVPKKGEFARATKPQKLRYLETYGGLDSGIFNGLENDGLVAACRATLGYLSTNFQKTGAVPAPEDAREQILKKLYDDGIVQRPSRSRRPSYALEVAAGTLLLSTITGAYLLNKAAQSEAERDAAVSASRETLAELQKARKDLGEKTDALNSANRNRGEIANSLAAEKARAEKAEREKKEAEDLARNPIENLIKGLRKEIAAKLKVREDAIPDDYLQPRILTPSSSPIDSAWTDITEIKDNEVLAEPFVYVSNGRRFLWGYTGVDTNAFTVGEKVYRVPQSGSWLVLETDTDTPTIRLYSDPAQRLPGFESPADSGTAPATSATTTQMPATVPTKLELRKPVELPATGTTGMKQKNNNYLEIRPSKGQDRKEIDTVFNGLLIDESADARDANLQRPASTYFVAEAAQGEVSAIVTSSLAKDKTLVYLSVNKRRLEKALDELEGLEIETGDRKFFVRTTKNTIERATREHLVYRVLLPVPPRSDGFMPLRVDYVYSVNQNSRGPPAPTGSGEVPPVAEPKPAPEQPKSEPPAIKSPRPRRVG